MYSDKINIKPTAEYSKLYGTIVLYFDLNINLASLINYINCITRCDY